MSGPDDGVEYRVPDAPSVGGSIRSALIDFYYNSWRLVPANVIWGIGLLGLLFLAFTWPLVALVGLVVLALPAAGIFRMAALIAREQPVAFSDALGAWREFLRPALVTGAVLTAISVVLVTNMLIGFGSREPLGWALATAATWGMLFTWAVAMPFWPLVLDPLRAQVPMLRKLRLAVALVLVLPGRFAILLVVVALVLVLSSIMFAALITISMAFVALLLARYTLPAADRLEQRATQPILE